MACKHTSDIHIVTYIYRYRYQISQLHTYMLHTYITYIYITYLHTYTHINTYRPTYRTNVSWSFDWSHVNIDIDCIPLPIDQAELPSRVPIVPQDRTHPSPGRWANHLKSHWCLHGHGLKLLPWRRASPALKLGCSSKELQRNWNHLLEMALAVLLESSQPCRHHGPEQFRHRSRGSRFGGLSPIPWSANALGLVQATKDTLPAWTGWRAHIQPSLCLVWHERAAAQMEIFSRSHFCMLAEGNWHLPLEPFLATCHQSAPWGRKRICMAALFLTGWWQHSKKNTSVQGWWPLLFLARFPLVKKTC